MALALAVGTAVVVSVTDAGAKTTPPPPTDNCGYPDGSSATSGTVFNENTVMRGAKTIGTGLSAQIAAFANDEKALLLGVNGASAFPNRTTAPYYSHVSSPSLGDTSKLDASGRPQFPALFITNISGANSASRAGDWQQNAGNGVASVDDIFGSWTTATVSGTTYTATAPITKNDWNGIPDATAAEKTAFGTEGYGAEVRWNVNNPALHDQANAALVPGNRYRFQILEHDGDQNKTGGDSGEFCVNLTLPGPPNINTAPDAVAPAGTFAINAAGGSVINDFATVTGGSGPASGTFTFKLFFVAAGSPDPCGGDPSTVLSNSLTPVTAPEAKTLDANGQATSSNFTTPSTLGTYYWQGVYTPDAGSAYTAATEACGAETVQIVNARILITPQSATNIVGNAHTLTSKLQSTTNGTIWTDVSHAGNQIDFSFVVPPATSAFFGTTAPGPSTASCVTTAASPISCSVQINDNTAEVVTVRATSTNFSVPNVTGTFTRSTGGVGCSAGDNTCDAQKTYITPKTRLTVSDQLIGLGPDATGSVTYTWYSSASDCSNRTTSGTPAGGGNITPPGTAPPSNNVTVSPGQTLYFEAAYAGNEGTFTTPCAAETASST